MALELVGELAEVVATSWDAVHPLRGPLRLLHRDLKPGNVRVGDHGDVRLIDFGIARFHSRVARTQTRSIVGTLEYMAPERFTGPSLDVASEVYALGCILFECLTGRRLIDVASDRRLSLAKNADAHECYVGAHLATMHADDEVVALVGSVLAHDPAARPAPGAFAHQCRDLAARLDGPALRVWARGAVGTRAAAAREGPLTVRHLTTHLARRWLDGDVPLPALVADGPVSPSRALALLVAVASLRRSAVTLSRLVATGGGVVIDRHAPDVGPTFRAPGSIADDDPDAGVFTGAVVAACAALGRAIDPPPAGPREHARWCAAVRTGLHRAWRDRPAGEPAAWLLTRCLAYDPADRPEPEPLAALARTTLSAEARMPPPVLRDGGRADTLTAPPLPDVGRPGSDGWEAPARSSTPPVNGPAPVTVAQAGPATLAVVALVFAALGASGVGVVYLATRPPPVERPVVDAVTEGPAASEAPVAADRGERDSDPGEPPAGAPVDVSPAVGVGPPPAPAPTAARSAPDADPPEPRPTVPARPIRRGLLKDPWGE